MILIAHNIRSLHNVGAILRSADAFGVEKVYLTGYTGKPPRKEIAKVALGAEHRLDWQGREDVLSLIGELKKDYEVIALDNVKSAVSIVEYVAPSTSSGSNEVGGLGSNEAGSLGRDDTNQMCNLERVSHIESRDLQIALIVGNEVEGLEEDVLAAVDKVVEIPMPGQKQSLNVSVATGIALFAISSVKR